MPLQTQTPRLAISFFRASKVLLLAAALCPGLSVYAQPAKPGTIIGRILNPASGEYLSNANVKVVETNQETTSGDAGLFQIPDVAAGVVTVQVTFTGFKTASATVNVPAGQTVSQNFELISSTAKTAAEQVVKLDAFVVSSEAAGYAKSIQEQRNAMEVEQVVSSDQFASVADGNVADFLKHLPGVDIVRADGNERNVRLRGLGPEYTSVQVDGVDLASADANAGASGSARAQTFEQVNLASMSSIELIDTVSANMDANAPAGTINLKVKRAFDQEGQQISWLLNSMVFGQSFNFGKQVEPDNLDKRRLSPGGIVEYSNTFLQGRLGVLLNVTESNIFDLVHIDNNTYNYTTTATDPRPAVLSSVQLEDEDNSTERFGVTFTLDFKVTPNFTLSTDFILNHLTNQSPQPKVTFNLGARATVVGDGAGTDGTSTTAGTVVTAPTSIMKLSQTNTYIPSFVYTLGDVTFNGKYSVSKSLSRYDVNYDNTLANFGTLTDTGAVFSAVRSSPTSGDWKITQTGGPDWSDGNNYSTGTVTAVDGRFAEYEINGGMLNANFKTNWVHPIDWEVGAKQQDETVNFAVTTEAHEYSYVGPTSGKGTWATIPSPYNLQFAMLSAYETSLSGKPVFNPSLQSLKSIFLAHPEYFAQAETATNYYDAVIGNTKHYSEDIGSGFLMATSKFDQLTLRAGLRYEDTNGDSSEFQPRTPAQMAAAGYSLDTTGKATTIPGIQYQYQSLPKVDRTSSYGDLFPSASARYFLTDNLEAQMAFSETIRRPTFSNITGVFVVNPDNNTATVPNIDLKAEHSDNLSARLSYYFTSVGALSVGVFQNNVKNLILTSTETAQQYGETDPTLQNYTFTTSVNSPNDEIIRGLEVAYNQNLTFLPHPFDGLSVRGSWFRNYAQIIIPSMAPQQLTGGFEYRIGRLIVNADSNWNATTPLAADNSSYTPHRTSVDMGASVRLTEKTSLFFSATNVTNTPYKVISRLANPNVATQVENWGTFLTFGIKGSF